MLIIYQPEDTEMSIRIHDTSDCRTFYTDEPELIINPEGVVSKLDDFVGMNKKQKANLTIHNLCNSPRVDQLVEAFIKYQEMDYE